LDLSLNNLTISGLHARSFSGIQRVQIYSQTLYLRNCRLRSRSLPAGVFDSNITAVAVAPYTTELYLSHIDPDDSYRRSPSTLQFDPIATRKLFSTQLFNPPGQAYAFRPPTAQQFEDSWGNFFDPFPAGLFYTAAVGSTYQPIPFADLWLGGACSSGMG
jgi:hypothetical protein